MVSSSNLVSTILRRCSRPQKPSKNLTGRLFLPSALVLFGLHELFHFADWLRWGLGVDALSSVRRALYPAFGAHDVFGYVSHAITQGLAFLALLWAFLTVRSEARVRG